MNMKHSKKICLIIALLFAHGVAFCSESYYVSPKGYFIGESEHVTDWQLAKSLVAFFKKENARTIADFGCGDGDYVNYFIQRGFKAVGYDGNPVTERTSGGTCFVRDFSKPIDVKKRFDWVVSLEVGEHLPKKFEAIFIENLIRHVKSGLVLSWAIKGQGGTGHFNEQNNDYIKKVFKSLGWINDVQAENMLRMSSSIPWFKNTIMVFRPNTK